jgi:hypothetical protein
MVIDLSGFLDPRLLTLANPVSSGEITVPKDPFCARSTTGTFKEAIL